MEINNSSPEIQISSLKYNPQQGLTEMVEACKRLAWNDFDTIGLYQAQIATSLYIEPHVTNYSWVTLQKTIKKYLGPVNQRSSTMGKIAMLGEQLFEEAGFAGNVGDYYNILNSSLPSVLESKQGTPLSLAMLYVLAAKEANLEACIIGLPGHAIAAVRDDSGKVIYIDCFDKGRALTKGDIQQRVKAIFSDTVVWNDKMLSPLTCRSAISRNIQNVLTIYTNRDEWNGVAGGLELQMLLWPKQLELFRDYALVCARIDDPRTAAKYLQMYLFRTRNSPGEDRQELEDLLEGLKREN